MQELYSKLCVAASIKFDVGEAREEKKKKAEEKFSCNLATILTRDQAVVAVGLKLFSDKCTVYISKNEGWDKRDVNYINKITAYLKSISKDAPIKLNTAFERSDVGDLFEAIMNYCSTKFESRLDKLKADIFVGLQNQNQHILSFIEFAGIVNFNLVGYEISGICSKYYKTVKDNLEIPKGFLRHLRKVGSYYSALVDITAWACKEKYKNHFSNMDMVMLNPAIISPQPIFSWANVIRKFIHATREYEKFKKRCLDNYFISGRLKEIYGIDVNGNPQLDNEKIEQHLFLHAEMNIVTNVINQRNKNPVFIAVSNYCCYLCESYIKFARSKGYQIFTSGAHNKLYHRWVLPDTKDTTFKTDALKYMIADLDQIIREELECHVDIRVREGESEDFDNAKRIDYVKVSNLIKTRQKRINNFESFFV